MKVDQKLINLHFRKDKLQPILFILQELNVSNTLNISKIESIIDRNSLELGSIPINTFNTLDNLNFSDANKRKLRWC